MWPPRPIVLGGGPIGLETAQAFQRLGSQVTVVEFLDEILGPEGTVLGCRVIGARAGELIHEWIAVINGGVKLSAPAGAARAHPTLSEISKRAAGECFSETLFSGRTKGLLKFLFHLEGRAGTPLRAPRDGAA